MTNPQLPEVARWQEIDVQCGWHEDIRKAGDDLAKLAERYAAALRGLLNAVDAVRGFWGIEEADRTEYDAAMSDLVAVAGRAREALEPRP